MSDEMKSAPVGVKGLLERWRKESRRLYVEHLKSMALRPLGQSDAYDACRAELSALAQQTAAVDEAMLRKLRDYFEDINNDEDGDDYRNLSADAMDLIDDALAAQQGGHR